MISLHNLKPHYGSMHKRKRLGTGQGSGHGQTSTRGQKGQHSTSGGTKPVGFEGGQTPLLRRIPKSGFSNVQFRQNYEWVNLSSLEKNFAAGAVITPADMLKRRLIKHDTLVISATGSHQGAQRHRHSSRRGRKDRQAARPPCSSAQGVSRP